MEPDAAPDSGLVSGLVVGSMLGAVVAGEVAGMLVAVATWSVGAGITGVMAGCDRLPYKLSLLRNPRLIRMAEDGHAQQTHRSTSVDVKRSGLLICPPGEAKNQSE